MQIGVLFLLIFQWKLESYEFKMKHMLNAIPEAYSIAGVVDRRIYTRIFQFPLRINVKISEHAQNFNVFKPRLVCRRILILPSGSSGNSQKSEILKNLKFSKIRNSQKSEILKNHKFSKI